MGILLSDLVYLLTFLLHLTVLLIALEWVGRRIPGAGLNPLRRFLFNAVFPFLKWGSLLGLRRERFDLTPAVMMVLILFISRLGLPWIAYFGFSIRS